MTSAESSRGQTTRIPIRIGFLKPFFIALGVTSARSYLELEGDVVRVRLGWSFAAEIPRTSIRSVRRMGHRAWSIGVRGWRGRWLVNGARGPIVLIEIDPTVPARTFRIPFRLRELRVSVDDPDGLVAALAPAHRRSGWRGRA
jgi:hypothetical protein